MNRWTEYVRGLAPETEDWVHEQLGEEMALMARKATQRGARLQILREWMRETDWLLFCSDHPEAHNWFDEQGVPK